MKTARQVADSLATVGGAYNLIAAVYLAQNRDNPNPTQRRPRGKAPAKSLEKELYKPPTEAIIII